MVIVEICEHDFAGIVLAYVWPRGPESLIWTGGTHGRLVEVFREDGISENCFLISNELEPGIPLGLVPENRDRDLEMPTGGKGLHP